MKNQMDRQCMEKTYIENEENVSDGRYDGRTYKIIKT